MGRLGVGWGPAGPAGWAPCSQGVLPMGRIPELRACPGLLEARHTAADFLRGKPNLGLEGCIGVHQADWRRTGVAFRAVTTP